ncbi:CDP-alcohol phosphatidyltransferase family protein [Cellulomonas sp. NS3]|uniref:CDP-alcohol phosphatidyltransferase family protein n=1 Tax=Cellulomonas sp. NS3 TaxID=2973977 RepID=UPI00216346CF|nr:CDP-alcohol phosphatidyltransferase family protein [Cellulomonas sp. NS3]
MTSRPLVDGPAPSHRDVVARLAAAQKSNRGAPGWSRWVNRPVGRQLAAFAYRRGMTPNQVTAASATVSAVAIALLATLRPTVATGVLVAVLLVLGFALDAADGQLARLTGTGSPAGEWLDHVVDATKTALIHVAVLVTWYRFFDLPDALLLVPLAFGAEASVFFFAIILSEQLRRRGRATADGAGSPGAPAATPASAEPAPVLRSVLVLPADYGVLCVAFLLLGFHGVFVVVYGLLMAANVVFLLGKLPQWYREMRALPAA